MVRFDSFDNIDWDLIEQKIKGAKFIKVSKRKGGYYDLSLSFDTETTSTFIDNDIEQPFAFMYVWQFGIDGYYCYGRTWEQFLILCNKLKEFGNLTKQRKLIIYIHNLSFEFQFFRKYFKYENVFAVDTRQPVKVLTTLGIEFRDSLILSGYSLEKTAENLTKHKIPKMVGDLDYTKIRTKDTTFTKKELGYMLNDVRVLIAYIDEQREIYGNITKIPLTNTGRVRLLTRENCFGKHNETKKKYQEIMKTLRIKDIKEYDMLKQAFAGGFTHANPHHVGRVYHNVGSIDFTSSYPTVMVAEQYPMSHGYEQKFVHEKPFNLERFNKINDQQLSIFTVKLYDVKTKVFFDNYISKNKCLEIKGEVENNGRIFSADYLTITITNIDWRIIKKVYSFSKFEVVDMIAYYKGYLPRPIIKTILELYKDKTKLKEVAGKETEYLHAKGMLNSVYGMSVTSIIHEEEIYDNNDNWLEEEPDKEKQLKAYNDSTNRCLYYAWGVFITSYSRFNLWTGILSVGEDYLYSDTDSIKMINWKKHMSYVNDYNKKVTEKLLKTVEYYGFDKKDIEPKDVHGIKHPLGVWDFEGIYTDFKTLGAKRYIYYENNKKTGVNELHITIAGLPKDAGVKYLQEISKDKKEVFKNFSNHLTVPRGKAGKLIHTYIDDEKTAIIKDFQGHYTKVVSKSSVHLRQGSFTLSMANQFVNFLYHVLNGETELIYKKQH